MKLDLTQTFARLWHNKDPFIEVEALQGEVFRELEARRTLRFKQDGNSYFIKIHRGVGWFEIIENLVRMRIPVLGASNEYAAIKRLQALDIDTMTIAGYGERGLNPATRQSFIITEDLVNTISLEDYCEHWHKQAPEFSLKLALVRQLAAVSRTMHNNGINHRDYYICHFLLDISQGLENVRADTIKVSLIDLHRAQLRDSTPERWAVKDIASLYFSIMTIGLTQRDLFRFMKIYANCSLRDCLSKHGDFWQKVERQGQKLWRRKQRKGDAI